MSQTLMLHRGSQIATREAIDAAPLPEATRTWKPIAHGKVIDACHQTLHAAGYHITREQLALGHEGKRFFGILDLERELNGGTANLVVGIRNSTDKTFPMGLVGGSRVFVCDNLSFSADLVNVKTKHTRYGDIRFSEHIARAVENLAEFSATETNRFGVMKSVELSTAEAESLVLQSAMDWNLLPLKDVPNVVREWRQPTFTQVDIGSLWALWNAYTHVLRGTFETAPARCALQTMSLQKKLIEAAAPQLVTAA